MIFKSKNRAHLLSLLQSQGSLAVDQAEDDGVVVRSRTCCFCQQHGDPHANVPRTACSKESERSFLLGTFLKPREKRRQIVTMFCVRTPEIGAHLLMAQDSNGSEIYKTKMQITVIF